MLSRRALLFIRRRDILIIKIYTLLPRLMICEFKSNVDDKKKKKNSSPSLLLSQRNERCL